MKEKPILFSTDMVRANLEDRKNQTRRTNGLKEINERPDMWEFKGFISYDTPEAIFTNRYTGVTLAIKCPYGGAGDVLWVRETFNYEYPGKRVYFKASAETLPEYIQDGLDNGDFEYEHLEWKPSIHMPKAAARIWLQIESIGVARVNDITEQEAIAEGVELWQHGLYRHYYQPELPAQNARESFRTLWVKINGPDRWAQNPWVWVIKFKVLSTTGKPNNLITH